MPNAALEFHLAKNWTIAAGGHCGWWSNRKRNRAVETYGGELEVRHYFNSLPMAGHHIGVYGQALAYDMEWGGPGYQSKFSYGGGVSYGYTLTVKRRLHIDFTLGLGYLGGEYKKYEPQDSHLVWQETRHRHWWGPTKLEVSLAWLIGPGAGRKEGGHE